MRFPCNRLLLLTGPLYLTWINQHQLADPLLSGTPSIARPLQFKQIALNNFLFVPRVLYSPVKNYFVNLTITFSHNFWLTLLTISNPPSVAGSSKSEFPYGETPGQNEISGF